MGVGGSTISPLDEEEESRTSEPAPGATLVRIGIFQVNPVTKTGMIYILILKVRVYKCVSTEKSR